MLNAGRLALGSGRARWEASRPLGALMRSAESKDNNQKEKNKRT